MRYGCCVGKLEQIDILARAGFDFCELPAAMVQPFDDDAKASAGLHAIEAAPLKPESFNVLVPAVLPLAGPKSDLAALRTYLRRAFGRMVRLGAPVVVLGSGGARRIPDGTPREEGLNQLAESLSVALEEAAHAGIVLALEHLNRAETNTLNSVAECQAFIEQRGLKGLKLLADLHHIELEHEPMAAVVAAAPLLAHVHVADGGRRAPGAGGYDYAGFMHALRQAGYDQRISAECGWEDLSAQAAGALDYMKHSWEQSANSRE
ncbi:MAG TPA: sugar phosphate isomerase/epimerase family protein [Anaerolineae bacterium]